MWTCVFIVIVWLWGITNHLWHSLSMAISSHLSVNQWALFQTARDHKCILAADRSSYLSIYTSRLAYCATVLRLIWRLSLVCTAHATSHMNVIQQLYIFSLPCRPFDLVHTTSLQNKASRKPVAVNDHQLATHCSLAVSRTPTETERRFDIDVFHKRNPAHDNFLEHEVFLVGHHLHKYEFMLMFWGKDVYHICLGNKRQYASAAMRVFVTCIWVC